MNGINLKLYPSRDYTDARVRFMNISESVNEYCATDMHIVGCSLIFAVLQIRLAGNNKKLKCCLTVLN